LAVVEYAVSPAALSRDVLPTAAHRWVMQQAAATRALDCAPLSPESSSIPWLSGGRIALADSTVDDCGEPQLAARLGALGFTHLLVREGWQRQRLRDHGDGEGLHDEARFADADVFSIRPRLPIYTAAVDGFWPREHGGGISWRWMGSDACWTIVAPTPQPRVTLELELRAFGAGRPLGVALDDGDPRMLQVATGPGLYRIGPLALTAGAHRLIFHSSAPATRPHDVIASGDRRALSFALGEWRWTDQ
jgi:hypothetical protein